MKGALFSIFEGLGGLAGGEVKSSRLGTIANAGWFQPAGMREIDGKRFCNGDSAGTAGDLANWNGIEAGAAQPDISSVRNVLKGQQNESLRRIDAVSDAALLVGTVARGGDLGRARGAGGGRLSQGGLETRWVMENEDFCALPEAMPRR